MKNIAVELLKTHLVIATVLEKLDPEGDDFRAVLETLHRTVFAHGWIQDEILAPALAGGQYASLTPVVLEIQRGHQELERMIKRLLDSALDHATVLQVKVTQLRIAIETHLQKEREQFYPLVQKVLNSETLDRLANEIAERQEEFLEVSRA